MGRTTWQTIFAPFAPVLPRWHPETNCPSTCIIEMKTMQFLYIKITFKRSRYECSIMFFVKLWSNPKKIKRLERDYKLIFMLQLKNVLTLIFSQMPFFICLRFSQQSFSLKTFHIVSSFCICYSIKVACRVQVIYFKRFSIFSHFF